MAICLEVCSKDHVGKLDYAQIKSVVEVGYLPSIYNYLY